MKRFAWGMLCALLGSMAVAAGSAPAPRAVEASMLVTGSIVVAPDGSVSGFAIDQPEKLPVAVVELITKAHTTWRFKPVLREGKPVAATAKMSVRVVARKLDDDRYELALRGAHFGQSDPSLAKAQTVSRTSPRYPEQAAREGVSGTVYLVLRLDRQGHVHDVAAEQVNLGVIGRAAEMTRWRRMLADASIAALSQWTFNPVAPSDDSQDAYRIARVPVHFFLKGFNRLQSSGYGHWDVYSPGPRELVPWLGEAQLAASGVDALPDGDVATTHSELRLLAPPGGT